MQTGDLVVNVAPSQSQALERIDGDGGPVYLGTGFSEAHLQNFGGLSKASPADAEAVVMFFDKSDKKLRLMKRNRGGDDMGDYVAAQNDVAGIVPAAAFVVTPKELPELERMIKANTKKEES
jgi:hypothetical protein